MGCCASVALDPKHVSQMLASNLKLDASAERDLIRSYRLFKKTDMNGDGRIEKSEFANAFKLEQDVFFDRLFSLIDTDGSGYVDFREFVIVLGAFQLSNAIGRVRFAFRLLDLDDNGSISKAEFKACIEASVKLFRRSKEGKKRANKNDWRDKAPRDIYAAYKNLFVQLDAARSHSIDYEDFADICVRYPKLFTPVNYIWNKLRRYAVPCAELCKVIARAGHQGFFYDSILENGWPGVKFYAPSWKLQERNVYMRSLSNLFKRRGRSIDQADARLSLDNHQRTSSSSVTRRSNERDRDNIVAPQSRATRRSLHSRSRGQVASERTLGAPNTMYDTKPRRHETENFYGHSEYERDAHREPAMMGATNARARHVEKRSPQPKFCRQFSWGSDDPNSNLGQRELQASNSMEKAYREAYPVDDEGPESWLEDDIRPGPKGQQPRFDKQDSIEQIWDALQACPSAQAARHYTPQDYVPDEYYQRLDDGVYFKKNYSAAKSSGNPTPVYQHERFNNY